MKIVLGIAVLLCLSSAAIAQPTRTQSLRGHVPANSPAPTGRLEAGRELRLAIGLPLRNREELTNLLQRIYDPASPDYHHYLTPAQFAEIFGPSEEDYQAVASFAGANGFKVTGTHPNRVLIDVTGSVSNIEKTFHLKMRTYPHPRESRQFYAPDAEPSLELATPVLHISGLDDYVHPHPMSLKKAPLNNGTGAAPASGSGPSGTYRGNDFRAAYVPGVTLTGTGQTVGLLEFNSGFYQSDITTYENQAGLPNVPVKAILLDGYDGGPGGGNDEVSLDIEMAISMAPGLASVIVYEGSSTDDILNRMATDNLAKQIGASWTYGIDAESDQVFLQFAAQGQSFFNASGDSDAYNGSVYPPAPPTDDPNLTCVGGTTLTTTGPGGSWVSETVWNWDIELGTNYDGVGGSGGISISVPIPSWQAGLSTNANHGSSTFRNLPDVALTADNIYVVFGNGQAGNFGGTSCATPLWAAFIALVNQQAQATGRPTLGFINPTIYSIGRGANYASCFHDIITGSNTWSGNPTNFPAVPGYDLCTGWGTPTGSNLVNLLAPPDALSISPLGGFASVGGVGGPFAPSAETFTLTNSGNAALNWTATPSVPWLNVSPSGGTLTPGGSATSVSVSLNAAASNLFLGTYGGTVSFTNVTDGIAQSRPFALTVIKPPAITAQPTNVTTIGGTTVSFTAGVSGGLPFNCQWLFNGTNLVSGGRISGAQATANGTGSIFGSTVSTLIISNVTAADGGIYSLMASNVAGVAFTSNTVLTVALSGPVIIQQPASQTVFVGATVQFAVAVDGTAPFTYQWMLNNTNLTDGSAISGSSTPILTIHGASSASIGTYSVLVSNSIGAAVSSEATLAVMVAVSGTQLVQNGGFETGSFSPWSGTGNFVDCSVASGFPAVSTGKYGALLGPAGSLGYLSQTLPTTPGQLYLLTLSLNSPDGLSPNEFLVGWNGSPVFDETNIGSIGWTNLQFYVAATGSNTVLEFGFQDDQSFLGLDNIQVTPLVSADGPPVIVTQPASQLSFVSNSVSFSVLSSGRFPLSYQWQFNGTNISNAISSNLSLSNLTISQNGNYSVTISNSLGSVTSSNAALTVLQGSPTSITFDDLSSSTSVPSSYDGLTWSNFYCLNGLTYGQPSGYVAGVVSSPNIALNYNGTAAGITAGTAFDFLSAYLTAAWFDNLNVEVQGYNGAALLYDNNYTLSATNPTLINFNYLGVTSVQFIASGGTPHAGYNGSGEFFALDSVKVLFPPIPPVITGQPNSETVFAGSSASFAVTASGSTPLRYRWSRNGSPIAGATSSTYTTNNVQIADNGSLFSCLVSNAYGTSNSSSAMLTVLNSPGSTVLSQGNMVVTITNYGGRISSIVFKGIELYRVGTFLSDWGLQTSSNPATFARNEANGGTIGQPMFLLSSNGNSAVSYTGTYTAGGANVAVTRSYALVPGVDVLSISQTFTNNSASSITLRCFDTFDPDWSSNVTQFYYMYAQRYSLTTNGATIQAARGIMTNDGTTIILGTTDAGAVLGACETGYFGIQSSANLNLLFTTGGANSAGAVEDYSLDMAREFTIAPGAGVSFVFYQSIASSVSTAELALENAAIGITNQPPVITLQPSNQTVLPGATVTFNVAANSASPLFYSWNRNNVPIAGATNSSYTTNNVQLADTGSQFSSLVSNAYGSTNSSAAVLTVSSNAAIVVGISPQGDPIEFNALTGTLTNFGFPVVVVTNSPWTGVNVLISYPGCLGTGWGPSLTDISNGVCFIKISDWGNSWTPVTYVPVNTGTSVTLSLGAAHPITAGLPATWMAQGYWDYSDVGANFLGWSSDTNLPSLVNELSPTNESSLLVANSIGAGRAVFIGWNVYGTNAGSNDLAVLRNSILWATGNSVPNTNLDHFTWSAIPSPQGANLPFPVTLTAQNNFGQNLSNFAGAVTLSASGGGPAETNRILEGASPFSSAVGTFTWGYPFTPVTNIVVTHVSSYFGNHVSLWTGDGVLLASQNVSGSNGVWTETPLSPGVPLSAGSNYLVSIYFTNGDYWVTNVSGQFPNGTLGASVFAAADSFPTNADPGFWPMVGLRYTVGTPPLTLVKPANAGPFTNGVWTGNLAVLQPASNVFLTADDGAGHTGASVPFNVASGFGVTTSNGAVGFSISGPSGNVYQVLASSNLITWQSIATVTNLTGTIQFSDPANTNFSRRFYRLQIP